MNPAEFKPDYVQLSVEDKLAYFCRLGERLLDHRYRYYVLDHPMIEDWIYDQTERFYEAVAVDLELAPVTNMVGFDLNRKECQAAKNRVDLSLDGYSLWYAEVLKVWRLLGPPKYAKRDT